MPRRKDKPYVPTTMTALRMPVELIESLNRVADAKMMSRSALIVSILTKATKATKRKEEQR